MFQRIDLSNMTRTASVAQQIETLPRHFMRKLNCPLFSAIVVSLDRLDVCDPFIPMALLSPLITVVAVAM